MGDMNVAAIKINYQFISLTQLTTKSIIVTEQWKSLIYIM